MPKKNVDLVVNLFDICKKKNMKNTILLLSISIVVFSCKKELPTNILTALNEYENMSEVIKPHQEFINTLDSTDINKIGIDSLNSLLLQNKVDNEMMEEVSRKLEELLKYNPEYSDDKEIQLKTAPVSLGDKYWNNLNYIIKRKTDLQIEELKKNNN